jgi:hypothetical protein
MLFFWHGFGESYCQPHFENSLIVVLVRPPVALCDSLFPISAIEIKTKQMVWCTGMRRGSLSVGGRGTTVNVKLSERNYHSLVKLHEFFSNQTSA